MKEKEQRNKNSNKTVDLIQSHHNKHTKCQWTNLIKRQKLAKIDLKHQDKGIPWQLSGKDFSFTATGQGSIPSQGNNNPPSHVAWPKNHYLIFKHKIFKN